MKELVNLSNYHLDNLLINNSAEELQNFLREHNLSGLEMLFYENWDEQIHKKDFVKGVHLNFWPNWLDFWLDNKKALIKEYGDLYNINHRTVPEKIKNNKIDMILCKI